MTRVVLSVGSNLGDRLARLQAAVDGLGDTVRAISPVFETDAWGPVKQDAFLNVVVIAEDPLRDAWAWLTLAQRLEQDNDRERTLKWGPRTLDVDLVCCIDDSAAGEHEVLSDDPVLTLPHPLAHERAFVLVPWLAVDPAATLAVRGRRRPVADWLAALDPAERDGVAPTGLVLHGPKR